MSTQLDPAVTTCGNCHLPMPKELRFCRNCGFRLGEGSAEYTETVRFQNVPPGHFPGPNPPYVGPMAVSPAGQIGKRRKRRLSGMAWMFLCLLIFFVMATVFTAVRAPRLPNVRIGRPFSPPRSQLGVNGLKTVEGNIGVTFAYVDPPGSPADNAGLVGGDIITTADGQPVHSDAEIIEILRRTPFGNTIEIVYIRDGETKNTKLTTISEEDSARLKEVFAARPEGRGQFGYDDDDVERVAIPGTKMFGIRLDDISTSLPADMAGIKEGDIVIEFADVPIRTPEELVSRVRRAKPYDTVDVVVMRGGERLKIPVKMGKR